MTTLRTSRLILRPFAEDDRTPFAALNAHAVVMADFPKLLSRAESNAIIDASEKKRERTGFGFSAVTSLDGEFLGMCGLNVPGFVAPFTPCVEIGWRFTRGAWGSGYASEAARAWLAYGFDEKALREIVSFTAVTNMRLEALMRRIGMIRDAAGDFLHSSLAPDHRLAPHVLYRIEKVHFTP
jgi:RimJ/RimL family protein N-acetyltransferase